MEDNVILRIPPQSVNQNVYHITLEDGSVLELEVLPSGLYVGTPDGSKITITPDMQNGVVITPKK